MATNHTGNIDTQMFFHADLFEQKAFDAQKDLHLHVFPREPFLQEDAVTNKRLCTQTLVHTNRLYTQTFPHTVTSFVNADALAHRRDLKPFFIQRKIGETIFYTLTLLHATLV